MIIRVFIKAVAKIQFTTNLFINKTHSIRTLSQFPKLNKMTDKRLSPLDPNSYARPDLAAVKHTFLDLNINFEKKILEGKAVLTVEKKSKDVITLILDTRDLTINKIVDGTNEESLKYILDKPISCFGSKLEITLPNEDKCDIVIHYNTSPQSTALQWLTPKQTAGKEHPYLFSHCEAIHCRSMLPCQDSPSIKSTYSAQISAPSALLVLMSAVADGEPIKKGEISIHKFTQKIPIPSYLIALAAGKLESRKIGPRTIVYSEKESVDQAATEFSKTESMLQIAEGICGPYVWGEYNLLVLPPSFPMGGMENPCLSFITPTLLAGDGSLANVVAHELSHSWTGNLVTNKNFEHFWLNEGFTMFLERKIESKLSGESARHLAAYGGIKELEETINNRGAEDPLTRLVPDLTGVDPDEAFSLVPYEKGHTFLFYLEELLGGANIFDPFLRAYMDEFKFKSITTEDFKAFLYKFFPNNKKELDSVDWNGWLYSPGMPIVIPKYDTSLLDACKKLAKRWIGDSPEICNTYDPKDFTNLSPAQRIIFVNELLKEEQPLSIAKLKILNDTYNMDNIGNSEIKCRWLRLCIKGRWPEVVPKALDFVTKQGRIKFIKPIYRDLNDWEEMRPQAVENFNKNKENMMYISIRAVAKILKLEE